MWTQSVGDISLYPEAYRMCKYLHDVGNQTWAHAKDKRADMNGYTMSK